jgi:hypothetical protein
LRWWKAAIWVGVIVGLVVGGAEMWSDFSGRRFDGKTRFTRLVPTEDTVEIWSFDPADGELIRLILPPELEVTTIQRGRWMAKAMPNLGDKYGWKWFGDSLAAFLGIPYTTVANAEGFWDRMTWMWLTRGKPVKDIEVIKTTWVVERTALDGQVVYDLSPAWQTKIGELFYSAAVAAGGWKLAVYNPTGVAGLGAKLARIAETQGFKVVVLAQGEGEEENCRVRAAEMSKEKTEVRWLKNYFGCDEETSGQLNADEVELIVGKRFSGWGG